MASAAEKGSPLPNPLAVRLSTAQIELLRQHGEERATAGGEVLFREGDQSYDFLVILSGTVVAVDGYGVAERELGVGFPGDFAAELNVLTGERLYTTAVVREPGSVLAVRVDKLRDLFAAHPELGEVIMPALLARRQWLVQHQAGFQIIGSRYSPDSGRLREFANRNRLPHSFIDLDRDPTASRLLEDYATPTESPVVLLRGGELLRNPSDSELAKAVGLTAVPDASSVYDLLVIGAGPAGLAASVYASSEGLRVAIIDAKGTGGQIGTTSRVENYLGFPAGVSGAEFATRAALQAQRFGADLFVPVTAVEHHERAGFHVVTLDTGADLTARTVIIATGMQYRRLEVPGIERFEGISVFYSPLAASDDLGEDDPVIVVGDGNSAGQAATFLADTGHRVTVLIQGADLVHTMASYLSDRINHDPGIQVRPYSQVVELNGDDGLRYAQVEDHRTGLRCRIDARAMFVLIGAEPHTGWLSGSVHLDEAGFVLTGEALEASFRDSEPWHTLHRGPYPLETSLPGMFAAGDVRANSVRRVGSAVGDGSLAAQLVHEQLGSVRDSPVAAWYGARTKRPE